MKMWKVNDNNEYNDDDNDEQQTNFDQKSSLESSAEVCLKYIYICSYSHIYTCIKSFKIA